MNIQGLSQDWNDLTTLISIPNRGQFGNPRYRGNRNGMGRIPVPFRILFKHGKNCTANKRMDDPLKKMFI